MKKVLRLMGRSLLAASSAALILSAAFVTILPRQADATYRIPAGVTLDASKPVSPGHVVAQTVIANDTQWAYYVSVPTTYDSTASKLWPCIVYFPTAECNYNGSGSENIIMTTHCWNGGLVEIVQTAPTVCGSFLDRFVVLTPYVDEPMIGSNQGGHSERLAGFINYMKTHMKIDSTQISLMGSCWGSGVAWNLSVIFPKLASCMVLMNGNDNWCSTYNVSKASALVNIPIKLLAAVPGGTNDSIDMLAAHNAIQACGTNKETITFYKCSVHEMWSGPYICGGLGIDTMKSVFDWMLTNKLTTAVAPVVSQNQNTNVSPVSVNNLQVGDKLEVIGLDGKILARAQGAANDRLLSDVNHGVHLVRVTHADHSVSQAVVTKQ